MNTNVKPFNIKGEKDYLAVRLLGFCDPTNLKEFILEMKHFLEGTISHVIVNCEQLLFISSDWIRHLLKIQVHLKQAEKSMRLILVNSKLMQLFKAEGVDGAFSFSPTLKEAFSELGVQKKSALDTHFINPFLSATLHVLKVQASVEAKSGKIYLKESTEHLLGDISGVIGIVSDAFQGSVVISFPGPTFLKLMSGMLDENYSEINQDILDGAGEITNMIFGQAKIVLNDQGYGLKTAIPSVVSGKNHSLQGITKGPVVVVPFTSEAGDFFVEICLS